MELNTQTFIRVLCIFCVLYTTADSVKSDDYDNIKDKISLNAKASYFDTMARMDTSWQKAPKTVTSPLTMETYVPLALRNGPTGSPYFEGLSYFGWCFAVTFLTFRLLWYLKVACAKRGYGIKVVKMEGKIGIVLMLLMAIMVIIFAIVGVVFTVDAMEIYRQAGNNGKVAVFKVATTTWNKLDIIVWELGQMEEFFEWNAQDAGGMTVAKLQKLQKLLNNDKDRLDTNKYENLIKLIKDKFLPEYQLYVAIALFALLAIFVILTIFRSHGRWCLALNSFVEPLWYFFMVFLVLITTFTIFGNDLCKHDDAVGVLAKEGFKVMKFDDKTSNLMGGFYKYYFVCDDKTDHPLGDLMENNTGTRNLSVENPLEGTILGKLLSPPEVVDSVNQMLKEQPEMKENLDNAESVFDLQVNEAFKDKLEKAKSLDELLSITGENASKLNTNEQAKLKFACMQMHVISQMAKLRVSTDCKNFIADIKEAKKEACDGLNEPIIIIAMIMVLMTGDFVVIIVQNVYSWCQSRRSDQDQPSSPENQSHDMI